MRKIAVGLLALCGATAANADLNVNFESYDGSAGGTLLTNGLGGGGQDGWYVPVAGSVDGKVYTYAGNTPGFASNPNGGKQFLGERSEATGPSRAQHDNDFSTMSGWSISYDFCALFDGTPPAAANLGSFSLQDSTQARFFIALDNFMDPNNPAAGWKAEYNVYDAAGTALNNQSPGADWTNLVYNHWYTQTTVVDFDSNKILSVSLSDITTGDTFTANPDWYLTGGANPVLPLPTGVRCFAGGNAGNNMGWDNINVGAIPTPGAAALLALGGLATSRRRR
jgi:hypothetical protein